MTVPSVLAPGIRRNDVVLTGAVLGASVVQVLWFQPLTGHVAVDLLVTGFSVVPLLWRRVRPVAAALAGTAAWVVPTGGFLFLGYVVALMLFYSVGRWSPRRVVVSGLVCAFAVVTGTVGTLLGPEQVVPGLLSIGMVVLAPYAFGLVMRRQEQEAADRLLAEREATRARAVEGERARIVRELHDVVGHEVTLMSIQSEAATLALALAPERAAEPIAAIRETAQRANRELRAILDLLGDGELAVAPDHRGLEELVHRAARLGIPAVLEERGQPWQDAPRHWLAVNRIVRECLTNAGKHAPGEEVTVCLQWAADVVRLEVVNAVTVASSDVRGGLGLLGMAERARTLGGDLEASFSEGRFRVSGCLPAPRESRS